MKKNLLLLCYFLYCTGAFAQSNYQKSKIVTVGKDTLSGWVDYKEWEKNPVSFKFADDAEGKNMRIYTAKEVLYLEAVDKDYFERAIVDISMDKVAPLEELPVGPDSKSIKDTVLLRLLYTGSQLNLYSYEDKVKIRYYIREKADNTFSELLYRKYYVRNAEERERIMTDHHYKEQLMDIARKAKRMNTAKLSELLATTDYTRRDLAKIVAYINGQEKNVLVSRSKTKIQFYAGIHLLSSTLKYSGTHELTSGATSKASYLPALSAGLDLLLNPYVKKTMVRFDFSFSAAKPKISKPMGTAGDGYISQSFDQYTFTFSPLFIYNIYNSPKLRCNLGTGVNVNCSAYTNNLYEEKYVIRGPGGTYDYEKKVDMNFFWATIPVRAGVILGDKLDIYAQYGIYATPIASFADHSVTVNTWKAGVNFIFR